MVVLYLAMAGYSLPALALLQSVNFRFVDSFLTTSIPAGLVQPPAADKILSPPFIETVEFIGEGSSAH